MDSQRKYTREELEAKVAEMRELRQKLNTLSPEQRQRLADKIRGSVPELLLLKSRLESFQKNADGRDPVVVTLADAVAGSHMLQRLGEIDNKQELLDAWSDGWLVHPDDAGLLSEIRSGETLGRVWERVDALLPTRKPILAGIQELWDEKPIMAFTTMVSETLIIFGEKLAAEVVGTTNAQDALAFAVRGAVAELHKQSGSEQKSDEGLESFMEFALERYQGNLEASELPKLNNRTALLLDWVLSLDEVEAETPIASLPVNGEAEA